MLLSSSPLLSSLSCQRGLQVLFLSWSLPGLVSLLLGSSGVLPLSFRIRPLGQSYWLWLAGSRVWGQGRLQLVPSERRFPPGTVALSLLLLSSGSLGGMNGHSCLPHAFPRRVTVFPTHLSLCVVASLLSPTLPVLGPAVPPWALAPNGCSTP